MHFLLIKRLFNKYVQETIIQVAIAKIIILENPLEYTL